jgi:hypothetical protein
LPFWQACSGFSWCFNLQCPNDMILNTFHIFICFFHIFSGKISGSFLNFNLGVLLFYCWVLSIHCIFWIMVLYQTNILQILLPHLCLVFSVSWFEYILKYSINLCTHILSIGINSEYTVMWCL